MDAALAYDDAVRRLAPQLAASYCNFPEQPGSMPANGQAHMRRQVPRSAMELNPQSPWEGDDVRTACS